MSELSASAHIKWEQAVHYAQTMHGTFTMREIDKLSKDAVSIDAKGVFKAFNGFHLEELDLENTPTQISSIQRIDRSYVHGMNSRYKFTLESPPGKKEWVLTGLLLNDKDGMTWPPPVSVGYKEPLWHFLICYQPVAQIIQDPNFTVLSIAPDKATSKLLRVAYEKRYPPSQRVDRGYALLDPDAWWCVREQEVQQRLDESSTVTMKSTNQYHCLGNGFPMLDGTQEPFEWVNGGNVEARRERVYQFWFKDVDNLSEEEFTLSAFGLPEPFAPDTSPHRYFLLIATGAGISLVLAFTFAWLARRARNRRQWTQA